MSEFEFINLFARIAAVSTLMGVFTGYLFAFFSD